jgi:hypothetical protein
VVLLIDLVVFKDTKLQYDPYFGWRGPLARTEVAFVCMHVGMAASSASWMLGWHHRPEVLVKVLGGGGFDSVEYVNLVSRGR